MGRGNSSERPHSPHAGLLVLDRGLYTPAAYASNNGAWRERPRRRGHRPAEVGSRVQKFSLLQTGGLEPGADWLRALESRRLSERLAHYVYHELSERIAPDFAGLYHGFLDPKSRYLGPRSFVDEALKAALQLLALFP